MIQNSFHWIFTFLLDLRVNLFRPIVDLIWANGGSPIARRME
jgi:hypothetical protein